MRRGTQGGGGEQGGVGGQRKGRGGRGSEEEGVVEGVERKGWGKELGEWEGEGWVHVTHHQFTPLFENVDDVVCCVENRTKQLAQRVSTLLLANLQPYHVVGLKASRDYIFY